MPRRKQQRELTFLQMQKIKTTLYDCTVDMRIEIPGDDYLNLEWIHKITLTTIAHDFVIKNIEYKDKIDIIYMILKKTLATTKRHWKKFNKNRKVLVKKNRHDAGHIAEISAPGVVYDTIKFSGQVVNNYLNAGPVNVECCVKLFLSPGVYTARDIYDDHDFPSCLENIRKRRENVEQWCPELDGREKRSFGETWDLVAEGVSEYEDYWETKRLRWARPPSDEESDDDYDSDDDEKTREEKREAKEFFKTFRGPTGRKRLRRDDDCCLS